MSLPVKFDFVSNKYFFSFKLFQVNISVNEADFKFREVKGKNLQLNGLNLEAVLNPELDIV